MALYVLSDFGAVALLRFDTFTRVVFTSYESRFDRTPAAVLSCLLVAVTLLVVLGESRLRGRAATARTGAGTARGLAPVAAAPPWRVAGLAAVAVPPLLGAGVPLAAVALWLTRGTSAGLDLPEITAAVSATLLAAGLAALVTTLLALPVGVLAARHRGRGVRALEVSTYAGHALPGLVVALALVFATVATPLYQELPVLVLAYAVLFLPLAVGAVRASVAQSPPSVEEVARSLGSGPLQVLRRVTLPLAGPGVAAGAALVLLTTMKELPATLLLHPTGFETLALRLWSHTQVGEFGAAAPHAALLIALAAVPTWVLGRRTSALAASGER